MITELINKSMTDELNKMKTQISQDVAKINDQITILTTNFNKMETSTFASVVGNNNDNSDNMVTLLAKKVTDTHTKN